ncbi:choline ABC transporter substrate-binding protein [Mangrovicoccus ximenensis]|uniref:choline ABC transporter substrate-binding protein n=1 Tax=Mangrovicoccus ximenensis TaxID=1911570 RepID=UPI000D349FB4|nr:choline ABC transporter substrate-binding protein [Mangrovicoccus ximenensis]
MNIRKPALLAALALSAAPAAMADCAKVRMAEPGWSDLALTTAITQTLLESLGYETETGILGVPVIYQSMRRGDLDVFMGYWDPSMRPYYDAYRDSGDIETVHQNLAGAKYTWAVPAYVYEAGVHSFADVAAHAGEFGERLYGIEPGSNQNMLDIVAQDAFGLGGWRVVESSEQGMLAQLRRSIRKKDWILFLAWAPHPMNTAYDIRYLEGGDAFYGPDFGGATVSTQVRRGYLEECPNVGRLLTRLTFDVGMESEGMAHILEEGDSAGEAARKVLAAHAGRLEGWLDGVETIDGAPGLAAVKDALGRGTRELRIAFANIDGSGIAALAGRLAALPFALASHGASG